MEQTITLFLIFLTVLTLVSLLIGIYTVIRVDCLQDLYGILERKVDTKPSSISKLCHNTDHVYKKLSALERHLNIRYMDLPPSSKYVKVRKRRK